MLYLSLSCTACAHLRLHCCLDTRSYNILGIFLNGKNGLKYFPLFLMGKLVSVFEQIGARPPPQNGLWSSTEVPLYFPCYALPCEVPTPVYMKASLNLVQLSNLLIMNIDAVVCLTLNVTFM